MLVGATGRQAVATSHVLRLDAAAGLGAADRKYGDWLVQTESHRNGQPLRWSARVFTQSRPTAEGARTGAIDPSETLVALLSSHPEPCGEASRCLWSFGWCSRY